MKASEWYLFSQGVESLQQTITHQRLPHPQHIHKHSKTSTAEAETLTNAKSPSVDALHGDVEPLTLLADAVRDWYNTVVHDHLARRLRVPAQLTRQRQHVTLKQLFKTCERN